MNISLNGFREAIPNRKNRNGIFFARASDCFGPNGKYKTVIEEEERQ